MITCCTQGEVLDSRIGIDGFNNFGESFSRGIVIAYVFITNHRTNVEGGELGVHSDGLSKRYFS